jgi:ribonucleoside-diphosphate reductase alpha chain
MRPENTTVFYFPMKSPDNSITKEDLKALDHLRLWSIYNSNWSEHQVSVTVSVQEHEWMETGAWVFNNFDAITGISFLPADQGSYKQAPFTACTEEEYNTAQSKMPKEIDWSLLSKYELSDETVGSQELACVAGLCEI